MDIIDKYTRFRSVIPDGDQSWYRFKDQTALEIMDSRVPELDVYVQLIREAKENPLESVYVGFEFGCETNHLHDLQMYKVVGESIYLCYGRTGLYTEHVDEARFWFFGYINEETGDHLFIGSEDEHPFLYSPLCCAHGSDGSYTSALPYPYVLDKNKHIADCMTDELATFRHYFSES